MYICYVDEAGDGSRLQSPTHKTVPVFIVVGIALPESSLNALTMDFLHTKSKLFPNLVAQKGRHFLDRMLVEIKGADIRRAARSQSRNERQQAIVVLHHTLQLLEKHQAKVIGRIWIKGIGQPFKGRSVYTVSIQRMCEYLQALASERQDRALVIADSRHKGLNVNVSHSIFTKKFKTSGDDYDRIVEMPIFGHSENHAGLQIADWVVSGLLFPIACHVYCTGHVRNVHVDPRYGTLKARFKDRLRCLQYRYQSTTGKWTGGLVVHDEIAQRSGTLLFT